MSPPDSHPDGGPLDPHSEAFVGAHALPDDVPLTDELCLFVASLQLDDRELSPTLVSRVDAYLAGRPELRRAVDDFARHHELLAEGPAVSVPEGFADRVLAARDAQLASGTPAADHASAVAANPASAMCTTSTPRSAPATRPAFARLAAAAALLLAVSLGWDLTHPVDTLADPDTARGRWIVDELQPDPFGPTRIDDALRERLPGPLDGDASAPERDPAPADTAPADTAPADTAPADGDPAATEPPR